MSQTPEPDDTEQPVERVLEDGLERIARRGRARGSRTRGASERRADGVGTGSGCRRANRASQDEPAAAATLIERAAQAPGAGSDETQVARALTETAAQAVAPTPAAEPVVAAAQEALTPAAGVSSDARRGRGFLRDAVLRRMGPLNALDARIYLSVNEAPHPPWLDGVAWAIAIVTTGGWIWVIGTLVAYVLRVRSSWRAVKRLLPSVVIATWLIEYPIKAYFRRRRPFVRIVQALVIGKRPGRGRSRVGIPARPLPARGF